ncbi:TPA: hypothetical protein ACK3Q6_001652 [Burkholderia cepacia]|uniref:hypothetical protein n=1 Tax=Burkholderia cepacia TaxID=292 RepID=UPI001CF17AE9|nr:hypothetical protein [Burkholderia cepacia]MCA8363163.1 hypothetical protein [Burkholderia cepacia]HDR9756471.1 hypothetical protein [Burkholderia cepacia ATCC 25416]HDV6364696.1 hypothetical protein [Burkholderia cepacia]
MHERYVVILREPEPLNAAGFAADLKEHVPETRVVEQRGDRYLIECPVYAEVELIDFFEAAECTYTKNRKYTIANGANHAE